MHREQLVRQRATLVRSDPYGTLLLDDWNKHSQYFVSQHLIPLLTRRERSALAGRISLNAIVSERVEAVAKHRPAFEAFSDKLTPVEFEQFCAEQLRLAGWSAEVTRRSRDQGVDVTAEKAGVRVVL